MENDLDGKGDIEMEFSIKLSKSEDAAISGLVFTGCMFKT